MLGACFQVKANSKLDSGERELDAWLDGPLHVPCYDTQTPHVTDFLPGSAKKGQEALSQRIVLLACLVHAPHPLSSELGALDIKFLDIVALLRSTSVHSLQSTI